ncbi:MAG: proteasome assembly chaperone family protein [Candidatus Helarchaeota archaeon]
MKHSFIKYLEKPLLRKPILIVGLPGVGNIGKIAAEYLIKELSATKFGIIFSPHFPYHVVVSEKGIIRLLNNEIFYHISEEKSNDLVILSGDYQSQTIFGQYEIAELIIEFCKEFNIQKIITMGGYAIGNFKESPIVYGATNQPHLISWIEQFQIKKCDIGSPIVGAAGLLIGLAKQFNIEGVCLLAETPGYRNDPKAAKSILLKVLNFLKLELDLTKLDEDEKKLKETLEKIQKIEKQKDFIKKLKEKFALKEDLSYFG